MGAFKDNPDLARMAGSKSSRKGVPNKATADLKEFISEALEANTAQILKDLAAMEPRDRVNAWLKMAEYVLPKLTRAQTELSGPDGGPLEVCAIRFIEDAPEAPALESSGSPAQVPAPVTPPPIIHQAAPAPVISEAPAPAPEPETILIATPVDTGKKKKHRADDDEGDPERIAEVYYR